MVQTIPAPEVALRDLKRSFGLMQAQSEDFFSEWVEPDSNLIEAECALLNRVKTNFLELMEDPPMLGNSFSRHLISQSFSTLTQSFFLRSSQATNSMRFSKSSKRSALRQYS